MLLTRDDSSGSFLIVTGFDVELASFLCLGEYFRWLFKAVPALSFLPQEQSGKAGEAIIKRWNEGF